MSYYDKYLKYKQKYLTLKKQMRGGELYTNVIILDYKKKYDYYIIQRIISLLISSQFTTKDYLNNINNFFNDLNKNKKNLTINSYENYKKIVLSTESNEVELDIKDSSKISDFIKSNKIR